MPFVPSSSPLLANQIREGIRAPSPAVGVCALLPERVRPSVKSVNPPKRQLVRVRKPSASVDRFSGRSAKKVRRESVAYLRVGGCPGVLDQKPNAIRDVRMQ